MHQSKAISPSRTIGPDAERFGALYAELAPDIFGFCYRRLNDADGANDATSRIFLKALNGFDTFQPDTTAPGVTFRAWVYRIACNDLIDHHRTAKPVESLDRNAASLSIVVLLLGMIGGAWWGGRGSGPPETSRFAVVPVSLVSVAMRSPRRLA